MVIRRTQPAGVITQPAHAWLSGQIGRAWGNEVFRRPPLWPELVFTADQHDHGFLDWDRQPTLNLENGWPHDYKTLPGDRHLNLWRQGIARLLPLLRFSALLVSRHAVGLYRRHFDWKTATQEEQDAVSQFMEEQAAFEREVLRSLVPLERYAHLEDETVRQEYSLLLGTWDLLSLHLCEASGADLELDETPALPGTGRVRFTRKPGSAEEWQVAPWPFEGNSVDLWVEERPIEPPYESEESFRRSLAAAPFREIHFRLVPDATPNATSPTGQGKDAVREPLNLETADEREL
jgi:hypothetical protein